MQKYLFLRNFSLDFPLEALVQGLDIKLEKMALEAKLLTANYTEIENLTTQLAALCERITKGEERWLILSALQAE